MTIWAYIKNLGIAEDEAFDAITGGPASESFSLRWARAAANGSRMGCIVCAALSVLVQKNHCAKQRAGIPMTFRDYIVAGTLLIVLTGLLISVPYCLARAVI